MQNSFNIPVAYLRQIEALTPDQLYVIRHNIHDSSLTDDETRDAMAQAVADGYDVADFLPEGPQACAQRTHPCRIVGLLNRILRTEV